MLQGIRDNAQGWIAWVIVGLISLTFAVWGVGEYMRPPLVEAVAEVNGVQLLKRTLDQEVSQGQQELRQLREQEQQIRANLQNQDFQKNPDFFNLWLYVARRIQERENETKESILTRMITREVLVQSSVNAGMRIGDTLLATHIRNNPEFQENGKFSQERYDQLLRYRPGFEDKMRRDLLIRQISQGVLDSAILTDYDQQEHTRLYEQQRSISYLIIPTSRFSESVAITDAEVEKYYQEHSQRYMTPEKVSIEYVELSQQDLSVHQEIDEEMLKAHYEERKDSFTTPEKWKARHILIEIGKKATVTDVEKAKEKIQDLLVKIRAGESFEKLAKEFSDDLGSRKEGGDLDWFGPDAMVKPFEEAVKAMKVGEVSEPVKSQFGFHIIQLDDTKPEMIQTFAEVRGQLEVEFKEEQARKTFYEKDDQLANLAFEHPDSLTEPAETLKLEVKTTGLFDRTGNTQENSQKDAILSHQKVVDTAFSEAILKTAENSEVIRIGEQHSVVLRLKAHKLAQLKPLIEVKDDIFSTLKQEKTRVEAKTLGESLLEQIKQESDPDAPIKAHEGLSWSSAHWVGRKDTKPQQEIVRNAFKIGHPSEKKALFKGVQLEDGGYALVVVLAVKDGVFMPTVTTKDDEQEKSQKDKKRQQQWALGNSEFNQMVSGLKAVAEIKDSSKEVPKEEG
ncbi:peptidylprolyl isomerase [Candidatus Parabeggiatoa sp. HSG14]|uniref:peptidylprolyl isomerase n=1 Tax=Candidatus Parabeggiatoa sp. HSG14 TaxID=3055593 RepID=UPI0025A7980A|nr:peptidylprolyl isomerase [Thiotrichales bacterium HSG14]